MFLADIEFSLDSLDAFGDDRLRRVEDHLWFLRVAFQQCLSGVLGEFDGDVRGQWRHILARVRVDDGDARVCECSIPRAANIIVARDSDAGETEQFGPPA